MYSYVVVDVFTDRPLRGNQLALFTDASDLSGEVMQRAARELSLSETGFLLPGDEGADAALRIFTPACELSFAGHPVLGAACVVGREGTVRMRTGAGVVPVTVRSVSEECLYGEMEQPIPREEPFGKERELMSALGISRPGLPVRAYRNGPLHVLVCLESEDQVRGIKPDLAALADLGALGVSCFAQITVDRVKTRMFAPGLGVQEDPATGSAAGPLALHLARHDRIAYGQEIQIHQGEEIGRPSLLRARVDGSHSNADRVVVGGSAVVVAHGSYRLS